MSAMTPAFIAAELSPVVAGRSAAASQRSAHVGAASTGRISRVAGAVVAALSVAFLGAGAISPATAEAAGVATGIRPAVTEEVATTPSTLPTARPQTVRYRVTDSGDLVAV